MSEPREVEAKFDLEKQDREILLTTQAIGRFTIQERLTAAQDDLYFDTSDSLLARAGSTLRVRRTKSGAKMTYKGLRESGGPQDEAHIASRPEVEVALDSNLAAAVSIDAALPEMGDAAPLKRAREIVGSAVLWPVARLENVRTTLLLGDNHGATLELAVDDCVGTRLSDGRTVAFDEVEIETKSAGRADLLEASSALRNLVPGLRPSHSTKLGRTLG